MYFSLKYRNLIYIWRLLFRLFFLKTPTKYKVFLYFFIDHTFFLSFPLSVQSSWVARCWNSTQFKILEFKIWFKIDWVLIFQDWVRLNEKKVILKIDLTWFKYQLKLHRSSSLNLNSSFSLLIWICIKSNIFVNFRTEYLTI